MRFVIVTEYFSAMREYVVQLGDDEAIAAAITKVKANALDCEEIAHSLAIRNPEGISFLSREYRPADESDLMVKRAERLIQRDELESPVVPTTGKGKRRAKAAQLEEIAQASQLSQTLMDLIP